MSDISSLGHRIAPPRFLLFLLVLAIGVAVAVPQLGWGRGIMAAFDVAATMLLLLLTGLFRRGTAQQMREASKANDANRPLLLGFSALVTVVVLVTVGSVVRDADDPVAIGLVIATLLLAWMFSNVVYALHYAHIFYSEDDGEDIGGLKFPDCDEPDYWDFLYFSVTLGMAFATSDVKIAAGRIRRIVIGQTVAAFVFNLGVIAFAVGALGG